MNPPKIELIQQVWTDEDEAYVQSDAFKEECRLHDEALDAMTDEELAECGWTAPRQVRV
jgi:hypothetical protein